ncbi:SgrR family transcriptional regulator, partial [Klebsiella pneumoniae]|nr:SgrR family transcriptional regulator [Klebsiella pneumoniae]
MDEPARRGHPTRSRSAGAGRANRHLIVVRRHNINRLQHPLIQAVEYWITPQLFDRDLGTFQTAAGQAEDRK